MHRRRHRSSKRGGDLESVKNSVNNTLSGWGNALSGYYNSAKNKIMSSTSNTSVAPVATYGGRTRRRKSIKRGGSYSANTPSTGIASHASPIGNVKTAQAHNWVGGKTRKCHHNHKHRHHKHRYH
jgi:hypothetical protein